LQAGKVFPCVVAWQVTYPNTFKGLKAAKRVGNVEELRGVDSLGEDILIEYHDESSFGYVAETLGIFKRVEGMARNTVQYSTVQNKRTHMSTGQRGRYSISPALVLLRLHGLDQCEASDACHSQSS